MVNLRVLPATPDRLNLMKCRRAAAQEAPANSRDFKNERLGAGWSDRDRRI